jgi:copper(I)-binding protein
VRLAVIAVVATIACGPGAETPDGRDLYLSYGCAACHGANGDGNGPGSGLAHIKPRDLRNVDAFSGARTAEGIASTIAFGVADGRTGMPAYPDIPKSERMAMANYILSLASAQRGIEVSGAWMRQPNPAVAIGAGYLELTNHESHAIALLGASSSAAGVVELHENLVVDGMMTMRQVKSIDVAPGATVALRQGGLHLMLIDLKRPLRAGDTIEVALRFSDGTTQNVSMPVRHAD